MSTRSRKHNRLFRKVKAIISSIIIAFFYSAAILFIISLFFGNNIKKGLSILNTLSLNLYDRWNKKNYFRKKRYQREIKKGYNDLEKESRRSKKRAKVKDLPTENGDNDDLFN